MSSGVFLHKHLLSRYVGRGVDFLDCSVGVNQAIFSHTLVLIFPHIPICNSNLFSMKGNYDPPHLLKFHSDFLVIQ